MSWLHPKYLAIPIDSTRLSRFKDSRVWLCSEAASSSVSHHSRFSSRLENAHLLAWGCPYAAILELLGDGGHQISEDEGEAPLFSELHQHGKAYDKA
jgi:hypothetical protein